MTRLGFGGRRAARGFGTLVVALCCSGAAAAGSSAATLHVKVTPAQIHRNKHFHILITGTVSRSELKGTPWLIAFDQFNDTSQCKRNASSEGKKPSARGKGRFFDRAAGSPAIGWYFTLQAGGVGSRRVCAYLFPRKNPPGTGTPLKRATAVFRVRR